MTREEVIKSLRPLAEGAKDGGEWMIASILYCLLAEATLKSERELASYCTELCARRIEEVEGRQSDVWPDEIAG